MTGHVRGDARKRSLESQHRLRIVNGLIVSCMCGAATNTDPYGDAVTTHIIAEARTDGAEQALREAADAWQWDQWTILTPKIKAETQPQRIIGAAQAVTDWLRDRAGGVR
jgi:hypothetical protein